ncbi:MAG TPA: response regulator [Polyangiaceae bacterium]|jgi:DNA-binding response OmpR family regulator
MADKKRILVVEDDDSVRALLTRQLQTEYDVHQAADAQAAMVALKAMTRVPDLIICDVMMPGMTGLQFAKQLRGTSEYKSLPIIFLTARTGALDVIEGINAGARHYITKPFNMKDLLDKVAKAIK